MNTINPNKEKSDKRLKAMVLTFVLMAMSSNSVFAQVINTGQLGGQINEIAQPVYTILSMIIAAGGLVIMGKSLLEGIKGKSDSWYTFGGVFIGVAIWFFIVPGIITWMFQKAGISGVNVRIGG